MLLSKDGFDVPVLLIAFRRPDLTARVLAAIRLARPQLLYVAIDAARQHLPAEVKQVDATKEVINSGVDWPCVVKQLHQTSNLGCRLGVEAALDWFFSFESEGVILEEDILPQPSFFPYCRELLSCYRFEQNIAAISGASVDPRPGPNSASYRFSRFLPVWGWASWRRAWQNYHRNSLNWPEMRKSTLLSELGGKHFARVISSRLDEVESGCCDTWDYSWFLYNWQAGHLACVPNVNLVENIGFRDSRAVHTKLDLSFLPSPLNLTIPLCHPMNRDIDFALDRRLFDRLYAPSVWLRAWRRLVRLSPFR